MKGNNRKELLIMITFPLESMSIDAAKNRQFSLVDAICRIFSGTEILSLGNLGLMPGLNQPDTTRKVERVLADFFNAQDAVLVWGAGTGAIRSALAAVLEPGSSLLVHDAPIYPTTIVTIKEMGITPIAADYNNLNSVSCESYAFANAALVQLTRQKPNDKYSAAQLIPAIKQYLNVPVVTDDNYAVMKIPEIGVEMGADLSTFSFFKLLGPEGIGCVVGKAEYTDCIRKKQYSGGCQIQGHMALQALRMLVYTPVALAIQAEVGEELVGRLKGGEVKGVGDAFLCNAQSKVLLVELEKDNAKQVLSIAQKFGALPYPVGSESIYEIAPLFYQVSGTFRESDPRLEHRLLRINPMRSGADTVIRILKEAIEAAE